MKSVVFAQEHGNNSTGKLVVDSIPRGAYVEVSGSYSFVGRTPFVIPQKLYGKYKVTGRMDGYETISSTITLARRGASQITLRLNKKTRLKAGYRSLLLPGWGQFYGQGKFKGAFSGLTQLTLVAVTLVAESNYQNAKEEYELALDHFNRVRHNLDEAEPAFTIVQRRFDHAKDVQGFRNALFYVTAGFWVYTFLDSMVFFSTGKKPSHKSIWQKPYISGQINHNRVLLSMRVSF
ncbi:MAG: PEGA domain-containing protein [bacterium]